jgi:hypothetical protein
LVPTRDLSFADRVRAVAEAEGSTPAGIELSNDQVLGTPPDPDYESSPGVALDGSLERDDESSDSDPDSLGFLERVRTLLFDR